MAVSRRDILLGSAGAVGAAAFSFPKPAIAQSEPIKIGWLAAMTGPSSAPTIGFNRGVIFAVDAINAAGGVKGRKIEVITRDTQGDPSKAVNKLAKAMNPPPGTGGFITGPAAVDGVVLAIKRAHGSLVGSKLANVMQKFNHVPTISGKVSFSPKLHSVFGRAYRIIELHNKTVIAKGTVVAKKVPHSPDQP